VVATHSILDVEFRDRDHCGFDAVPPPTKISLTSADRGSPVTTNTRSVRTSSSLRRRPNHGGYIIAFRSAKGDKRTTTAERDRNERA
jgi:hypothetical protein